MARPRKMTTDDMIIIVNAAYEEHGDPSRLKCSCLAEYAVAKGFDVKAYDFRRNPMVRERIGELSDLSPFFTNDKVLAYKGLDVDAFIKRNKKTVTLKNALVELDTTWRRVYERTLLVLKEREKLTRELNQKNLDYEQLACKYNQTMAQVAELRGEQKEMLLKNRYLTDSVKKYLYPAIANEILRNEGVLEYIDTEVMPSAMNALTEPDVMATFSKSISLDQQMLTDSSFDDEPAVQETREESLLRLMAANVNGGHEDAQTNSN